jgi:hypothetical protein
MLPWGAYRPTAQVQNQLSTFPVAFAMPSLVLPFQTTAVKCPIWHSGLLSQDAVLPPAW